MKKLLLFLVLFSLNVGALAQSPMDSLFGIWDDQSLSDTTRLSAMNEIIYGATTVTRTIGPDSMLVLANKMYSRADEIRSKRHLVDAIIHQSRSNAYLGNMQPAKEAAHRASGLAEEIAYHYGHARALGMVAVITLMTEGPVPAIQYYDQCYKAATRAQTQSAGNAIFGDIAYFPFKHFIPKYHNDVGRIYKDLGAYVNALDHFEKALKGYLILDDQLSIGAVNNNIATVHMDLEELDKAMEYFEPALAIFEEIGHKDFQANVYGNMASIYMEQTSYDEAETYLNRNLKIREEMRDSLKLGQALGQFAHLYSSREEYQKSLEYAEKADKIFTSRDAKRELIHLYLIKGHVYEQLGELDKTISFYEESLKMANELQSLDLQKDAIASLYKVVKKKGQIRKALEYHEQLLTLSDSLNIDETGKKLLKVEFSQKHMTDSLLQQEETMRVQLAHDKEILQQTNTRNIMLGSGLILLLISGGLWNRLSFTRKSKAALQEEKDRSEGLLLNILPAEVAEELKQNGEAQARDFDLVSIIFTDFKDFTQASENLSAGELVNELNHCFKGFDAIMEKYGIEKIKTIGDAYMAAGGIPVATPESPQKTVLASLELCEFVARRKQEREAEGKIGFEMRCGIHTGPVVAGIVGVKKFQYDIWGDTVNTASRMESYGEVGKVNISQDTFELIQDVPGFTFEKRGKIEVKGKGKMDMYFVGGAVGG